MKKSIINFSEASKKSVLRGSGALLAVIAAFLASAPCTGFFYEPEIPQKLKK